MRTPIAEGMISLGKRTLFLHTVLPLALGGIIYILFRSQRLLISVQLASFLGISTARNMLSSLGLPEWFLFSLPDGLWLYSLVFSLQWVWQNSSWLVRSIWAAAGVSLGVGWELGQALALVPGTFDPVDLGFYVVATALAVGAAQYYRGGKAMKRSLKLTLISFLILSLFVVMAVGSGESTEPEKVETEVPAGNEGDPGNQEDQDEQEDEKVFRLGETVRMGDLVITINSARYDQGNEWTNPDSGEKWLVLDFTLENTGDEAETISSLMMFSLYDKDNYQADQEIFADTKGSMDGTLGAGRSMRGEIAWAVGDDSDPWELVFEPDFWDLGQAIFLIQADDVD